MKQKLSNNKFKDADTKYLTQRKQVAKDVGFENLFEIADQFGLYSGIQTIAKSLAVYELVKQTLDVPGNIVEFGCWKGSNLLLMAKVLKLLQPNTMKEVFAFDSFEGLQTFTKKDNVDGGKLRGAYKGNEKILREFIKLYEMEHWVHLIKGDATKTIKKFDKENSHMLISFAYIDFDLYTPTQEALKFLNKRLSVGGLIAFDEALLPEWEGEGRAMVEFLEENEGRYEPSIVKFTRQPTAVLKRIR
jgi:hypothetical protein